IKIINLARQVVQNDSYEAQVVNNPDEQNRQLAMEELIKEAINQERRRELDLYKRYATDPDFKRGLEASIIQFLMRSKPEELDDILGA
ncbi:hypothetical protein D0962_15335, partial [Leptolyngbyaceae cyanobacterium CCMR0082]|nr:hypothetical protein [Adonisia turfae CCMR0082]